MKDFKITEAMSMEDQENIIKNIKMVLDQLPAAKAQMKAFGASEQEIKNFQTPILKFLDDAKREMESTEGDEAIAAARKELGGMFEEKINKMENLNEGKNKKGKMTYEAALREIDAQSAIVAMEAKIEKLKEMAEAKEARLNMVSEDENLSELIDKRAMNEMKKEIKQIKKMQEKLERLYEKKNGKKPEVIDEDEEMNEGGYGMPSYEEDDDKPSMEEEKELDEAHCNTEEDDTNPTNEEEVNEEIARWQKLAGISEMTTPNNPKVKDKDGKEIKKHDELETSPDEMGPEKYISTLKKLGYNVDMDWYNSQKK